MKRRKAQAKKKLRTKRPAAKTTQERGAASKKPRAAKAAPAPKPAAQ